MFDADPKIRLCFEYVDTLALEAKRIAEERIKEIEIYIMNTDMNIKLLFNISFVRENTEGYILDISKVNPCDNLNSDSDIINTEEAKIIMYAGKTREFIAGVGKLIRLLLKCTDEYREKFFKQSLEQSFIEDIRIEEIPEYPIRIHYMPAHFGNSFEVAWPGEMQRYLEDMALAGASGYGDWFDPNDMPDPYNPHVYCSTSMSLWERKKEFLRISKKLGLDTMLWVAHNVGFVDQMRPEWVGVRSHEHRVQGQVLCPSIPEAREICIQNQDNLFRDLKESGVEIDKLCFGPYDDGGCACNKCQPYYPTFLEMVSEIVNCIKKYYPLVTVDICGWWASEDEMKQLKDFVDTTAREWFGTYQFSATYNVYEIPANIRNFTGDIPLSSFMHIGFSDNNNDVYYKSGIHSAPDRIKSVVQSFKNVECKGFHTYNETFGEHLNIYISSRLGRNPNQDINEILTDYCRQMYALKGKPLKDIVDILTDMQYLREENAEKWLLSIEKIKTFVKIPSSQKWAFEHVAVKAELMYLDHKIGDGSTWSNPEDVRPFIDLIKKRLELSENLWRNIYGLGVLRHCFIPDRMLPGWYAKYAAFLSPKRGIIKPGVRVSRNA